MPIALRDDVMYILLQKIHEQDGDGKHPVDFQATTLFFLLLKKNCLKTESKKLLNFYQEKSKICGKQLK